MSTAQNPLSREWSASSNTGPVSGPRDIDSSYPDPKSALGKIYPTSCEVNAVAEAQDSTPVANGVDNTPTNWFELAVSLCIPDARLKNAFDAFSQAVSR